jgi:carboxypeptidase family protein
MTRFAAALLTRFLLARQHSILRLVILTAAMIATPLAMHAQRPTVHVIVTDTTGRPIAEAAVTIVDASNTVRAETHTDAAGRAQLALPRDTASYELQARRIGYAAAAYAIRASREPVTITLRLVELPQTLATVKVTAAESEKHKRLFVDADAIANNKRTINDGMDVITKMRPDMVFGLGGRGYCPAIHNLWINGRWIPPFSVTTDAVAVARARSTILRSSASLNDSLAVPDYIVSALAEIRPQDIAEMSYHDCTDMSLGRIHGENALFVVLKTGVRFDPARGTYAIGGAATTEPKRKPARPPVSENAEPRRILGVFDAVSGDPIDRCAVTDSATGTTALTTTTGTISLAFLEPGMNTLTIAKPGYDPISVQVDIAPSDSVPVTIVLWPARTGVPR